MASSATRIVLDTNVLLSLWFFSLYPAGSRFSPLKELIEAGRLIALSRTDCLAEFERVLGYPEFRLAAEQQSRIFAAYSRVVLQVPAAAVVSRVLPRCQDRDDQKFLELARDGGAQMLVTSDKALLRLARNRQLAGMFRILTPEQLIASLVFGDDVTLLARPALRQPHGS